jgi:hypothetical protein
MSFLGFGRPFQGHNLSWYDVNWETEGGGVDVDVVGMVQVASQRCHSDICCDRHEVHQCHLVERDDMDIREGCVGMVVAM